MHRNSTVYTALVLGIAATALLLYGPIEQFEDYHRFADTRGLYGVPHALNVLSNLAFLLVGVAGLWHLRAWDNTSRSGRVGYALFFAALLATAAGSSFYHLAPDDARLVWDRLPIAIACAGLLAAVYSETHERRSATTLAVGMSAYAVASVFYWQATADLRPYILLQAAPLVFIPLWQACAGIARSERLGFGAAIGLYAFAKAGELFDEQLYALGGVLSGHTIKHLLAAAAALAILYALRRRNTAPSSDARDFFGTVGVGRSSKLANAAQPAARANQIRN